MPTLKGTPKRTDVLSWLLAALLMLGATACDSAGETGEEEPGPASLRELAEERDFLIGAAVETGALTEADYAEVLAREFNLLTPGNAMKFGPLRPNRSTFAFGPADTMVDFAEDNGMAVRGHTLLWHNQNPGWVTNGSWTRLTLMDVLREHITTVVGHYRGRILAWDVVNEAIDDDGNLRDNLWLRVIGPDYIELAFEWAHEADPEARLFYNDYNAEGGGAKSDAVYELVRSLRQRGVPIHGVGLQMHVSTEFAPSAAQVAANIERLGNLGLEVHVTEMDVRMPMPATPAKLARQADVYETMLDVCLEAWNCTAFVLWGFTDRYSWVPETFPGEGAALVFDENYDEKPAYRALHDVLEGS